MHINIIFELQKIKDNKKPKKKKSEKILYLWKIKITSDFYTETMQARKQ